MVGRKEGMKDEYKKYGRVQRKEERAGMEGGSWEGKPV